VEEAAVTHLWSDGRNLPITVVNSILDSAEFVSDGRGDRPGFQVKYCDDRCVQYGLVVHMVLTAFLLILHHAFCAFGCSIHRAGVAQWFM